MPVRTSVFPNACLKRRADGRPDARLPDRQTERLHIVWWTQAVNDFHTFISDVFQVRASATFRGKQSFLRKLTSLRILVQYHLHSLSSSSLTDSAKTLAHHSLGQIWVQQRLCWSNRQLLPSGTWRSSLTHADAISKTRERYSPVSYTHLTLPTMAVV